jgi:hypothetical protein
MSPSLVKVGNTGYQGAPLMDEWLPPVLAEGQSLGYGAYSIFKIFGPWSSFSGATHEDGLAVDFIPVSHIVEWVQLFRRRGAAAWPRGAAWYTPKYIFHIHLQLNANNKNQIGYWQIVEGVNGLNGIGDGGKDVVNPRYSGVLANTAPLATMQEDDMTNSIFMMTNEVIPNDPGNPIYLLVPGKPVHHVTSTEWALFARLGAVCRGGVFWKSEVDTVNSLIQV